MTLRKGILIAVAVTAVVLTLVLWHSKPLRHIYLGLTMDVEDIRFYGRVIDQHGQPVVGAEVPYSIGGSALGGYRGEGKKITDDNGEFTIDTEGSSLSFDRIKHPDIEFGYPTLGKPGTWGYSHSSRLGVYGFQPQAGDNQALWTETSPEKPYIFRAWRIGKGGGEVSKNLIEGYSHWKYKFKEIYTLGGFNSEVRHPLNRRILHWVFCTQAFSVAGYSIFARSISYRYHPAA